MSWNSYFFTGSFMDIYIMSRTVSIKFKTMLLKKTYKIVTIHYAISRIPCF